MWCTAERSGAWQWWAEGLTVASFVLGLGQVPVCGRSWSPPRLPGGGPRPCQQCFFVLAAPGTEGLKLVAAGLVTRQRFKSK